jgi:hypothetical protein
MKRFKYFLIMVSLVSFAAMRIASAYEPAVQWQKTFGGSNYDEGYSVQQTSDDGYIIAGWTRSFGTGSDDVYLIKTDSKGNLLWQKTFGGSSNDYGYSVQRTSDGGYIIAGETWSFNNPKGDVYLIKTDPNGNQEWQKTFGGSGSDWGSSVRQTADGGYIIAGTTDYFGVWNDDVYIIKTNSEGELKWQRIFGGTNSDWGNSVQQTYDGGYIIAGNTYSFGAGDADVYLIKTDSGGNLKWQKTFGGSGFDWGRSVQQTTDGGFIIAGSTFSFGDPYYEDIYLIKTDPNGNLLWQKTFGGKDDDWGLSVQQASDGGYIIAGTTGSFGAGYGDVYLIKTDPNGNLLWQKTFGGSDWDGGNSVQQTSDGGYIIAGDTYSFGAGGADVYLIKLSSEVCRYALAGDMNNDCKFDFYDFALMAANWLIDCNINPAEPACVPK